MNFDNRLSEAEEATRWWWIFLITGIIWLWLSMIVFRFDVASVTAIGILIGVFVIIAGVNEFVIMGVTQGGWRWVHLVLGVIFIVFGILALFHPGSTFVALSAIMGWVLLFKGTLDITIAFMTKGVNDLWWLQLIAGGVEIGLAIWAAGYWGRKAIILVAFVGVWCLMRGITEIILAFSLRSIHKKAEKGTLEAPAAAAAPPSPPAPESGGAATPA